MEKAKAMGGDLAKAAKSMGLEVKTSDEFARTGTVEGLGSASYVADGFNKPDGTVFGPLGTPDGDRGGQGDRARAAGSVEAGRAARRHPRRYQKPEGARPQHAL